MAKTYYRHEFKLDDPSSLDSRELRTKLRQISAEQAAKYRPGKFGIIIDKVDAHALPVLEAMTKKQIKVLYFLMEWCFYNGIQYYAYFDCSIKRVCLQEGSTVYEVC